MAGVASELGLAVATEGSLAAAWGRLCVEEMKASRLQVWRHISHSVGPPTTHHKCRRQ